MNELAAALYAKLAADSQLTALLSVYDVEGTEPPRPAIFNDPIPEDAVEPYAVLRGPIAQENDLDDNESIGPSVLYDVAFYDTNIPRVIATVQSLAQRARAVLHRQALAVNGFTWVDTQVRGPIVTDEEDLYGRTISVRVMLHE